MARNKHLLLWSSAACLLLLLYAAGRENFLKDWRRIQKAARSDGGPVEVRLRQIVVPGLRATDRCVSCHLGMAPGETGITGSRVVTAHKPVVHDPAEFGCTVCHGGQGRATEKNDAHGDVHFWPEPMIPVKYAYAGCGSCHTHLWVPNAAELSRGRHLFESLACLDCHKMEGRGGTLRVGGAGGMEGPDLTGAGVRGYDAGWYAKHLDKSRKVPGDIWASSFGPMADSSLADIATFLSSRVGAPGLVEAKALFHSLGCRGCHKVNGVGGDDGPDLTRVGEKDPGRLDFTNVPGEHTLANWFAEHFRSPGAVVPGALMPTLGLTENQINLLVFYLESLRHSDHPERYWPKDRIRAERFGEREFAIDGATLYGAFCAACHGSRGEGMRYPGMSAFPAIGNIDFLAIASDSFLTATVQRGRPGRRMPAWGAKEGGLRPEEVRAVVDYVRSFGSARDSVSDSKPRRWVAGNADAGGRSFALHCANCHGANGQGAEGPALNNAVFLAAATDTYIVETTKQGRRGTSMDGFERATTAHPALAPSEIEDIVTHIRSWEHLL